MEKILKEILVELKEHSKELKEHSKRLAGIEMLIEKGIFKDIVKLENRIEALEKKVG